MRVFPPGSELMVLGVCVCARRVGDAGVFKVMRQAVEAGVFESFLSAPKLTMVPPSPPAMKKPLVGGGEASAGIRHFSGARVEGRWRVGLPRRVLFTRGRWREAVVDLPWL